VSDGSLSATGLVSLTVAPVNDPPVAQGESYVLGASGTLTVPAPGILLNDTDVDGDSLGVVLVAPPTQGTLVLSTNGGFSYTPTNHFNGTDSFTYRASDGLTNSALATATITVSNEFRIVSLAKTNASATATWTSIAGRMYQLQYTDDLKSTNWHSASAGVLATGSLTAETNATGNAAQRFYRVKLLSTAPAPEIQSIRVSNGVATVTWTTVRGRDYRLQYKNDLQDPAWTELAPGVVAVGPMATGTNTVGAAARRFYRVRLVP
jgi:hypothetical protein